MRRLHHTVRRFLKALSPSRSGLGFAFSLLLTAVIASGCGAPTPSGSSSSSAATPAAAPISWTHFEVGEAPAPNAEMLLRGGEVYADNCSACHGDNGDGAGSAFVFRSCPWDLDGDGDVGITDFLDLLGAWGPNPGHPADFDGDDIVGITDFLELLGNWGPCP